MTELTPRQALTAHEPVASAPVDAPIGEPVSVVIATKVRVNRANRGPPAEALPKHRGPRVVAAVFRSFFGSMRESGPIEHRADGPLGLTPEEVEIARLVALGMMNPEIASARKSRVRTVSTHLSNIYKKLEIGGAGARVRLGNMVRAAGLLD